MSCRVRRFLSFEWLAAAITAVETVNIIKEVNDMKRNKSMPQVLLCVLLCVALVIPFMKATVFAEDSVGTDGTMTENGTMPENAGIEENENELLPGSGELFYEDAASAAMDTSMDGDALSEESESDATEESNKEGVFQDGENPAEDGNGTSGDGVFPEGDDSEQVEKGDSADNDFLPEDGNGDSADNDFLSEDGNGDSSEDASRPEMQYPGEDNDVPEITETGEEESGADPGEILPGEESAGTDQDPSDDAQVPAGEGASSEMTMLPEESAQDNLEEITAEEPSMAADAQEQSAAVSYDPAAGPCPLARELTYNGTGPGADRCERHPGRHAVLLAGRRVLQPGDPGRNRRRRIHCLFQGGGRGSRAGLFPDCEHLEGRRYFYCPVRSRMRKNRKEKQR